MNADISPELHRELKRAVVDRGTSIKDAITEAITAWLATATTPIGTGESPSLNPPKELRDQPGSSTIYASSREKPGVESASSEENEWIGRLKKILASGHHVAVTAIQHNLIAFGDFVELARDRNAEPQRSIEETQAELEGAKRKAAKLNRAPRDAGEAGKRMGGGS